MRCFTARSPTGTARGCGPNPEVGIEQLHQQLERRALARAVRTQEAEDLALVHRQRETVKGPIRARPPEPGEEVLGELVGFDRGGHS